MKSTKLKAWMLLIVFCWQLFPMNVLVAHAAIEHSRIYTNLPGATPVKSVDHASGKVNLSRNLMSIAGFKAVISYHNANVHNTASMDNEHTPTGCVGLGWSLHGSKIVRNHQFTANEMDDEYLLHSSNGISTLIFDGKSSDDTTIHVYRVASHPHLIINFHTTKEQWELIDSDGSTSYFGDGELIDHTSNATESLVVYNNWIGSTMSDHGSSLISAWNLSSHFTAMGQENAYFYFQEQEHVGQTGLQHTRACYLQKVVDLNNESIQFEYDSKQASEYVDPHTENGNQSGDDYDAYQERYQRHYLKSMKLFNEEEQLISSVELEYDFLTKSSSLTNLTKRVLTEIKYLGATGQELHPSDKFDYYGLKESDAVYVDQIDSKTNVYNESNGALFGSLKTYTSPQGAQFHYEYDKVEIGNSNRKIKLSYPNAIQYTSMADGYKATANWNAPQLFYADNYVVAIYELIAYDVDKSFVQIYDWVGHEWKKTDIGLFDGHFYDDYHPKDYYQKSFYNRLREAAMKELGDISPEVNGVLNAFNDDLKDIVLEYYTVGKDFSEGKIGKAFIDFIKGEYKIVEDILLDIVAGFEKEIDKVVDELVDFVGTPKEKYQQLQKNLYEEYQTYTAERNRKEYHIAISKNFFAITTTFGGKSVHIIEKDSKIDGLWHTISHPVNLTTKFINLTAGDNFVAVHDEIMDFTYITSKSAEGRWKSSVTKFSLVGEASQESIIDDVDFNTDDYRDQNDQRALRHSGHRSAIAAASNTILGVVTDPHGMNGDIHLLYHDKQMKWHKRKKSMVKKDKFFGGDGYQGAYEWLMGHDGKIELNMGNGFGCLQVYDNLDPNLVPAASDIPIIGDIIGDFVSDYRKVNSTYGIFWDENMEIKEMQHLHTGWGQTSVGTFVSGNSIQKTGTAHSAVVGTGNKDSDGWNYAFRYNGEKFHTQKFESIYYTSAFAPGITSTVVEASDPTKKTPKFYQFDANVVVDGTKPSYSGNDSLIVSEVFLGHIFGDKGYFGTVSNNNAWTTIAAASKEQIPAPEFVKQVVNLSFDILNLILQVIFLGVPVGEAFIQSETALKVLSKMSTFANGAGFFAMFSQPMTQGLIDDMMKKNHIGFSVRNGYIMVNGKLFHRKPDGNWTKISNDMFQLRSNDRLVASHHNITGTHVNFTVKRGHASDLENYTVILKNGEPYKILDMTSELKNAKLVIHQDSLSQVGGPMAFAAYGPVDDNGYVQPNPYIQQYRPKIEPDATTRARKMSYREAQTVYLHKISQDNVSGKLHDYVVRKVGVSDGYEMTYRHYHYDNETATFNSSTNSAIYAKVTEVPSTDSEHDEGDNCPFGSTEYYFYNADNYVSEEKAFGYPKTFIQNESPAVPMVEFETGYEEDHDTFKAGSLKSFYGRNYLSKILDKNGKELSKTYHCFKIWEQPLHDVRSHSPLDDHKIYQVFNTMDVSETDGVQSVTSMQYDEYPLRLRSTTMHGYMPDGTEENHISKMVYAWERYPEMKDANQLKQITYKLNYIQRGNDKPIFLNANATSYKPWSINGKQRFAAESNYVALFSNDLSTELFSHDYAGLAAAEIGMENAEIAAYEDKLVDFELKHGRRSDAVDAAIGAVEEAHDTKLKLSTYEYELHNLSTLLHDETAELLKETQEIDQARAEMKQEQAVVDGIKTQFDQQNEKLRKAYKKFKQLQKEREIMHYAFMSNLVALGIEEAIMKKKIKAAWRAYQKELAIAQQLKMNLKTALKELADAREVLNALLSQYSHIMEELELIEKLIAENAPLYNSLLEAYENAISYADDALEKLKFNVPDQPIDDIQNEVINQFASIQPKLDSLNSFSEHLHHEFEGLRLTCLIPYLEKKIEPMKDVYVNINFKHAPNLVFDVKHNNYVPGTPVWLYKYNGTNAQKFRFYNGKNRKSFIMNFKSYEGDRALGFSPNIVDNAALSVWLYEPFNKDNYFNFGLLDKGWGIVAHPVEDSSMLWCAKNNGLDKSIIRLYDAPSQYNSKNVQLEFKISETTLPSYAISNAFSYSSHDRAYVVYNQGGKRKTRLGYYISDDSGYTDLGGTFEVTSDHAKKMIDIPARLKRAGKFKKGSGTDYILGLGKDGLYYFDHFSMQQAYKVGFFTDVSNSSYEHSSLNTFTNKNGKRLVILIGQNEIMTFDAEFDSSIPEKDAELSYDDIVQSRGELEYNIYAPKHAQFIGDINGDQKDDLVVMHDDNILVGDVWDLTINPKSNLKFKKKDSDFGCYHSTWRDGEKFMMDMNKDGMDDLVVVKPNGEAYVSFSWVDKKGEHRFLEPTLAYKDLFNGKDWSNASGHYSFVTGDEDNRHAHIIVENFGGKNDVKNGDAIVRKYVLHNSVPDPKFNHLDASITVSQASLTTLDHKVDSNKIVIEEVIEAYHDVLDANDSLNDSKEGIAESVLHHQSNWVETHRILQRHPITGSPIAWRDGKRAEHSVLLNHQNLPYATFVNANYYTGEAVIYDFENGFSPEVTGTAILSNDQSFTGSSSFKLSGESTLKMKHFTPEPNQKYADSIFVLSCWVKFNPEQTEFVDPSNRSEVKLFNQIDFQFIETSDSHAELDISMISNDPKALNQWHYLEKIFSISRTAADKNTMRIQHSGNIDVFIDDIVVRPLNSVVNTKTYDASRKMITSVDNKGMLTKHVYDNEHNLVSTVNASGESGGIHLSDFSRRHGSEYVQNIPNAKVGIGFNEQVTIFEDDDTKACKIEVNTGNLAVAFQMDTLKENAQNSEIKFGDVSLKYADGTISIHDSHLKLLFTVSKELEHTNNVLLTVANHLYFFIDGEPVYQGKLNHPSAHKGPFMVQMNGAFRYVLIGEKPVLSMAFADGLGKTIQTQHLDHQEENNSLSTVANGTVYSGWGMPVFSSLNVEKKEHLLGYDVDFITSYDYQTGISQGHLSDYFASEEAKNLYRNLTAQDANYAGVRHYYSDDQLHRLEHTVRPGEFFKDPAVQNVDNSYQDEYGDELMGDLQISDSKHFKSTSTKDARKKRKVSIKDLFGRKTAEEVDGIKNEHLYTENKGKYQKQENRIPNYFDPTLADNESFVNSSENYDLTGQMHRQYWVDEGSIVSFHDKSGAKTFEVHERMNHTAKAKVIVKYNWSSKASENKFHILDSSKDVIGKGCVKDACYKLGSADDYFAQDTIWLLPGKYYVESFDVAGDAWGSNQSENYIELLDEDGDVLLNHHHSGQGNEENFFIVGDKHGPLPTIDRLTDERLPNMVEVDIAIEWPLYSGDNKVELFDEDGYLVKSWCDPNNCFKLTGHTKYSSADHEDLTIALKSGKKYTLVAYDIYGDGWGNGSYFYMRHNGDSVAKMTVEYQHKKNPVSMEFTAPGESNQTTFRQFTVNIDWDSYAGDNKVVIVNELGEEMGSWCYPEICYKDYWNHQYESKGEFQIKLPVGAYKIFTYDVYGDTWGSTSYFELIDHNNSSFLKVQHDELGNNMMQKNFVVH